MHPPRLFFPDEGGLSSDLKPRCSKYSRTFVSVHAICRSQIVFEVKPWEVETNLKALFEKITKVGSPTSVSSPGHVCLDSKQYVLPTPSGCTALLKPSSSALSHNPVQSKLEGLAWGEAFKLVPVAYGVQKLVLSCVVEDDKVKFSSWIV